MTPLVYPQDETYWGHVNPIGPRACYDEGKRCAETLFFDDPHQRRPVITLAKEALGWELRVSIEDGLKETVAYFRKLLSA